MTYAELSTHLVWAALTVLTVAMISFAIDLTRLGESRAGAEARARRLERSGALVGAATGASETGALAGPDDSADLGAEGDADPAVAAAAGSEATRTSRAAGIGMSTTFLGWLLLLGAIVARAAAVHRAPWANMYEFTLVGTFVALTVFLVMNRFRDLRFLGAFVTFVAVMFLAMGQEVFFVKADGVQPALQSYWLYVHVGVAITATGVLTVGFLTSALQLLRDSRDNGSAFASHPVFRWLDGLPTPAQLESLSFRINSVGFVLWTFTLIAGSIWAEHAWGRYWGWDPKEVWTFIVWVVYAAYLHARTTRGWSGRKAAYFVMVGFACVIFNFTAVNIVINGEHSYSGLTS